MQIDANSPEDYFSSAGSREAELRRMDAIIQKHAPALTLIDADLSFLKEQGRVNPTVEPG